MAKTNINDTRCQINQALTLQRNAAQMGFDWQKSSPIYEKVIEELDELRQAHQDAEDSFDLVVDEMGDLLFACLNLARHLSINPSVALSRANKKFIRRFQYIQDKVNANGQRTEALNLKQLNLLWDEAKGHGL